MVRDAEHDGRRVRALGGLWSLSAVVMLQDYVIDTSHRPTGRPRVNGCPIRKPRSTW
jgi:hypothetical protein